MSIKLPGGHCRSSVRVPLPWLSVQIPRTQRVDETTSARRGRQWSFCKLSLERVKQVLSPHASGASDDLARR